MNIRGLLGALLLSIAATAAARADDFNSWYTVTNAASNNNLDQVIALLRAGRSANDIDGDGRTAIFYAAMAGNAEMAKVLIDHNADVLMRDRFGDTPLHWAAERNRVEVVRLLLAAKAPVDAQNRQGITPLMLAAENGQTAAAKLLLQNGADPRKADFTGRDAVTWSSQPALRNLLSSAAQHGSSTPPRP